MLRTLWGPALIALIVTAAGCGGGGGASAIAPAQELTLLPMNMTGSYTVPNLGLPGDTINVEPDGQIVVSSSSMRGTVTIGTCSPSGRVMLDGTWQADGRAYSIVGSGTLNAQGSSVTLRATVTADSAPMLENAQVSGTRLSSDGTDIPPPPPLSDEDGGDNWDTPPAPPMEQDVEAIGSEDTELPPPPPTFD